MLTSIGTSWQKHRDVVFFLGWTTFGSVLVFRSQGDYSAAGDMAMFALLFLLYGVWTALRALRKRERWHKPLFVFALAILLFIVATRAMDVVARRHERSFQPVIAALERHKDEHGAYPAKLDELVPARLARIPDCPLKRYTVSYQAYASRHTGKSEFTLTCPIGRSGIFLTRGEYDSDVSGNSGHPPAWYYHD